MTELQHTIEGGTLTVFLEGKVDTLNSGEIEAGLSALRESCAPEKLVIDCEKLKYISSSGLRVILRAKKSLADTILVNVSPEVWEIFDMTGFTEMMDIRKAYRVISVEGCELIGEGANGKVYRTDPETIVKVYLNPDALPEIHRERELARTAFVRGIPTAIPYDVVRIEGGGYGSVFELLNAKSLAKLLAAGEISEDEAAERSVGLLKLIHSTPADSDTVPDMKAVALDWAEFLAPSLPEQKAAKLRSLIGALPDDGHFLHGDFHVKNVMMQNDEALLIDMDTLCHGHPVFELASMYNAYCGFSELDHSVSPRFLGIPHETAVRLWKKMLALYLGTDDEERLAEVESRAMLIGHTRLMRRSIRRGGLDTESGRAEIENSKRHICEILDRIDTLDF